jgi:raffinose/stachyose/melibiose transport system substrate-binding protein
MNLSPEKLDTCVKFMDYSFNKDIAAKTNILNAARLDAEIPKNQLNVPSIYAASNKYGTFTITDQAFPTEVADELFRVQDGIALNQVTPQQGAARIQAAIEAYLKNK